MINGISRRDLLANMSAATVGGIAVGLGGGRPAYAGAGWGPGPNSGLPFWLGAHGDYPSTVGLLPAGRSVDLVNLWESDGAYMAAAAKDPTSWGTKGSVANTYLKSGQASAVQWSSSPFCSGSSLVIPNAWPTSAAGVTTDTHLNCSRPPTYTGAEDLATRTAMQRRVWQIAANGWMDQVWRTKLLTYKKDYFVKQNLRNVRIVIRVAHELNTSTKWGQTDYKRAYGMLLLQTVGDYQLVQEGLRRYMAVFMDVFGNVQSSIPGDFAYADSQLWPYWNPGPSHKGPVDPRLTCPANAKLVGPDYYNFWPATVTQVEWNTNLYAQSKQGWPRGVGAWLNWAKSTGRPLCLGEWALMNKTVNPDGSRPAFEGWDNPVFIKGILDFCKANAADIGFVSYFNKDDAPTTDRPGHLIKTWSGIDDPSASCVRTPVGDDNRCGARAFKQWMASNA